MKAVRSIIVVMVGFACALPLTMPASLTTASKRGNAGRVRISVFEAG